MSHIATVEVKVKDLQALKAACDKMGFPIKLAEKGTKLTASMYGSQTATGHASVNLPSFEFPVVFDVDKEKAYMDKYPRGKQEDFDHLKQGYAAEVSRRQMQDMGWMVEETVTADGKIELMCTGA